MSGRLRRRLRWGHLAPVAVVLSFRYRWRRGGRAFSSLLAPAGDACPPSARNRPPAHTVASAVRLATLPWPLRTTCLVRAAVLARLLRRYGYPATVVIGAPESGVWTSHRPAHAWVELGAGPGVSGYRDLVRLIP